MSKRIKTMDDGEEKARVTKDEYNSSEDLFADSQPLGQEREAEVDGIEKEKEATAEERSFAGVPLADLRTYTKFSLPDPSTGAVMVSWPLDGPAPTPYPDPRSARDAWDDRHVRMPCSKDSVFPVQSDEKGRKELKQR
jgi:hypothetical protein